MNLQIENLRTFIAVADTKGFSKAGVQVKRPQSTVSMQIKRLEGDIGKPLFERIGKTIKLTIDGVVLLKFARIIVKTHDEAVSALSNYGSKNIVRFGSPEHYTAGILPKLLAGFAMFYPDVQVNLRCDNSGAIKASVEMGELDVGLCTQMDDGGRVIYHDPLVWITNDTFAIQKGETLRLVIFEEDCIFRRWAIEALEKTGIKYRIVYVGRSISGVHDAVRAGLGIAPVLQSTVPIDLKIVGVEERLPALPVSNVVLHKIKWPVSETVDAFAEHLIRFFQKKAFIH